MRDRSHEIRIRTWIQRGVFLLFACLLAPVVAGCGGQSPFEIEEVRERAQAESRVPRGVTSDDRFAAGMHGHGLPLGGAASSQPTESRFSWRAPADWVELPPRPMREVGFRAGGAEQAECVLSVLSGDGGGLVANVNRWRAQMGLEPLDAPAIDDLSSAPFLGASARVVDVEGTYLGLGDQNLADARLVGLILERPRSVVFLKLTGPKGAVGEQREALFAFASSVREQAPTAPKSPASGLTWSAPAGWLEQGDRPMREVTFTPAGQTDVECYVAVLGGRAGGVEANLNRWRDQMGRPPLTSAEIEALPRLEALGREGTLIEIEGDFTGMEGATHAGSILLGFVVERDADAVFVKLTGPAEAARAERGRFESFCRSLRDRE